MMDVEARKRLDVYDQVEKFVRNMPGYRRTKFDFYGDDNEVARRVVDFMLDDLHVKISP